MFESLIPGHTFKQSSGRDAVMRLSLSFHICSRWRSALLFAPKQEDIKWPQQGLKTLLSSKMASQNTFANVESFSLLFDKDSTI